MHFNIGRKVFINMNLEVEIIDQCKEREYCNSFANHWVAVDIKGNIFVIYYNPQERMWSKCPKTI